MAEPSHYHNRACNPWSTDLFECTLHCDSYLYSQCLPMVAVAQMYEKVSGKRGTCMCVAAALLVVPVCMLFLMMLVPSAWVQAIVWPVSYTHLTLPTKRIV
eukprot:TRINITY_DN28900_c0_g1_i2.p3 TRINITY_DN28900_c0_g1~~TRINITY_DN28900_c0_g1_i2.p3  ORF type:complete len:101 (-),score=12.08 TRINITY_DN28900_c0_g1_i2:17-319(-)